MNVLEQGLAGLAVHLSERREAILHTWRRAVRKDPDLTTADSLPRLQLTDHVPGLLKSFERRLHPASDLSMKLDAGPHEAATAHGLHRWQQGYDLQELSQELGRLNQTVVIELEEYDRQHPQLGPDVMSTARWMWAEQSSNQLSESIAEYHRLQQIEAEGHMNDLERALEDLRELEHQRGALWHQAAHDLRGNLGIVITATAGLNKTVTSDGLAANFLQILDRNVASLHLLLDDITALARFQAGREIRHVAEMDAARVIEEICGGLRVVAEQRGLFLRSAGPSPFVVSGDAVKLRRLVQNLVINATKYTKRGGVTVGWGESHGEDSKRWLLRVEDTGPGFDSGPGSPMVDALGEATDLAHESDTDAASGKALPSIAQVATVVPNFHSQAPGEGIGLSIVKRLADLLQASIEVESSSAGTVFRVYLPRRYGD